MASLMDRRQTTAVSHERTLNAHPPTSAPVPQSRVTKILIVIDPGTAHCKAVYRVFRAYNERPPKMCEDRMILENETILWDHGDPYVPTQLAYRRTNDIHGSHVDQIWGARVSTALLNGIITSDDIISDIKLLLFADSQDVAGQQAERRRVREFLKNLRRDGLLPPLPDAIAQIEETSVHEFLGLFADFLRLAYQYILGRIRDAHPDVDVDHPLIETAIPLPVRSAPKEVQLVLAAVEAAGIPNPFMVGESAAALAYHLQLQHEKDGRLPSADCTVVIDMGGGSMDVQGYERVGMNPFRLQEKCLGDTRWVGGSCINKSCADLVMREIEDPSLVLPIVGHDLDGRIMSEQDLRRAVEEAFEVAKRRFGGTESITLKVAGLPHAASSKMRQQCVALSPDDLRDIYRPTVAGLHDLSTAALREIADRYAAEGRPRPQVEVLFVGGGSSSPYLQRELKEFCRKAGQELFGYDIVPRNPNDNSKQASSTVALGCLLLLTDKEFITKRVITRGYCMAWDNELTLLTSPVDDEQPTARDLHDGERRALKVSKFFVRPGELVPLKHAVCHEGWRGLFVDEVEHGGWSFLEDLYWTESIRDDDVWVERPGIDMHPMPHPLKFFIPHSWSTKWKPRRSPGPLPRRWYKVYYRVRMILNGTRMSFKLEVPKSGRFDESNNQGDDRGCKVQRGEFNINGVFKLSGWE